MSAHSENAAQDLIRLDLVESAKIGGAPNHYRHTQQHTRTKLPVKRRKILRSGSNAHCADPSRAIESP